MSFLFGHRRYVAHRLFAEQDRYAVAGVRDYGMVFSFGGTRTLASRTYPERAVVRFSSGEVTVDAERGVAVVMDMDAGTVCEFECGTTDYDCRFLAVNRDFARAVRGLDRTYLTDWDLLMNTDSAVSLTEGADRYDSGEPTQGVAACP
jgi:hypothetical protein